MAARETAIIFGVGPGLGWALAKRFKKRGYGFLFYGIIPTAIGPPRLSLRRSRMVLCRSEDIANSPKYLSAAVRRAL